METTKSDLELVVGYIAEIPLPLHGRTITSSIPIEVIQAAQRLMQDKEDQVLRD